MYDVSNDLVAGQDSGHVWFERTWKPLMSSPYVFELTCRNAGENERDFIKRQDPWTQN